MIESVDKLEDLLSAPTPAVVDVMRRLRGDIILLGAAGKIGPSLARMTRRASDAAGVKRRIIAVSRFSEAGLREFFQTHSIETIACDLLDEAAVAQLPLAENVIYLAGLKFGSSSNVTAAWAMNTWLPTVVCRKFRASRIVAYSTGAVYGLTNCARAGSLETDEPQPIGEYAMSCLGRERMFQHFSGVLDIPVALIRLFYACELRYGVIVDIARKVLAAEPIDLTMAHFNVIWQGDNNAMTLLAFDHVASPPFVVNLSGPEKLSVREVAAALGDRLGKKPRFRGTESDTACLGDTNKGVQLFGRPCVTADQLIEWIADWVLRGGPSLGKPTHFEARDGRY